MHTQMTTFTVCFHNLLNKALALQIADIQDTPYQWSRQVKNKKAEQKKLGWNQKVVQQ